MDSQVLICSPILHLCLVIVGGVMTALNGVYCGVEYIAPCSPHAMINKLSLGYAAFTSACVDARQTVLWSKG